MSDLFAEDEDSDGEDVSEGGHEGDELIGSQSKEEQQRTVLEEIRLGSIEFKSRKTTDDQPPMNSKDTKYKKWPRNRTELIKQGGTGGDAEDKV